MLRLQFLLFVSYFLFGCLDRGSYHFPDTKLGSASQVEVTITNPSPANIEILTISSNRSEFTADLKTPLSLKPYEKKTFRVIFKPTKVGTFNARLTLVPKKIVDMPDQIATLHANAKPSEDSGSPILAISPGIVDFGALRVGASLTKSVMLKNEGTATLVLSSIQTIAAHPFKLNGPNLPLAIDPQASVEFHAEFAPVAIGVFQAQFQFTTNEAVPKLLEMRGEGVAASIQISTTSMDFGEVRKGLEHKKLFRITNNGNAPLTLSPSVFLGDEGFSTNLASGTVLGIGMGQDFELAFKPSGTGVFNASVQINSDAINGPALIALRGVGTAPRLSILEFAVDFGTVPVNTLASAIRTVTLKNIGTAPLIISGVRFQEHPDAFSTDFSGEQILPPQGILPLNIIFHPAREGLFETALSVLSDDPEIIPLPIRARAVAAKLFAEQPILSLGDVLLGSAPRSFPYRILNTGSGPLTISSISIENDTQQELAISPNVNIEIEAASYKDLVLTFQPKVLGSKDLQLTFASNAFETNQPFTILSRVVGPQLVLAPTSMDFRTVAVSQSTTQALELKNIGDAALTIKSLSVSSSSFTLGSTASLQIPPGESRFIQVTFTPVAEGRHSAEIVIDSDSIIKPGAIKLEGYGSLASSVADIAPLIFDTVFAGESLIKDVQILNKGPGILVLESATITGTGASAFRVINLSTEPIPAGNSAVVSLEFSASIVSSYLASMQIRSNAINGNIDVSLSARVNEAPQLPPKPDSVATPSAASIQTDYLSANAFLLSSGIQKGAQISTFVKSRAGLAEGAVYDSEGRPLSAVTVSVVGHPEFGSTLTREDGRYSLLINAGGIEVINFERAGYLRAQRQLNTEWNTTAGADDVFMVRKSSVITSVDFSGQAGTFQTAKGELISDLDGQRTPVVAIPGGTKAEMILPNGTKIPLSKASLSITEFTQGDKGLEAMPASLPPSTGYTYAAEFSIDQAVAAGAKSVIFDKPVFTYLDDFIGLPTGSIVPSGYYDYSLGQWIPSENGRVVEILKIQSGKAVVDTTGDGIPDSGGSRYQRVESKSSQLQDPSYSCRILDPLPIAIPDGNTTGIVHRIELSGNLANVSGQFRIGVNISHTYIGDLSVKLISPRGTQVVLHNRSGLSTDNIIGAYGDGLIPYQSLSNLVNEPLSGVWQLAINDAFSSDVGRLNAWSILQNDSSISCGNYVGPAAGLQIDPSADSLKVKWPGDLGQQDVVLIRRQGAPVTVEFQPGYIPTLGEAFDDQEVVYVGRNQEFIDTDIPAGVQIYYALYKMNSVNQGYSISSEELGLLASIYPQADRKKIWRTPMRHFSTYDLNPVRTLAEDAKYPQKDTDEKELEEENECQESGSIIDCQSQTLGEVIPVQGTELSLSYSTASQKSRRSNFAVPVRLLGSTLHPDLLSVKLTITVAGQIFQEVFEPQPNLKYVYVWDGKDQFGREVNERVSAAVEVGYTYRARYAMVMEDSGNSFGRTGGTVQNSSFQTVAARTQTTATLRNGWTRMVGIDVGNLIAGGWGFDIYHKFDPRTKLVMKGDGSAFKFNSNNIVTVGGMGTTLDPTNIYNTRLSGIGAITAASDGSLYLGLQGFFGVNVYRMRTDGTVQRFAGRASGAGFAGDGGPAIDALMNDIPDLAFDERHEVLYIPDLRNGRVRAVDRNGIIRTVAGNGGGICTESVSGLATENSIGLPYAVAVNSQGDVFINSCANVIYRVRKDGTIERFAGKPNSNTSTGDNGPAVNATFRLIADIAVGLNDELYISEYGANRVRVIDTSGIIRPFAGTGGRGSNAGVVRAVDALMDEPQQMAVGKDGRVYIVDQNETAIRVVDSRGFISNYAGCRSCVDSNLSEATATRLSSVFGIAIDGADTTYLSMSGTYLARIGINGVQKGSDGSTLVAAEGGLVAYQFDSVGRHIATLDTVHGTILYQFVHDGNGRLSGILDRDGLQTAVSLDANDRIYRIVSPYGESTQLGYTNGMLSSVMDPAGRETRFEYDVAPQTGLLKRMVHPKGVATTFSYDSMGYLLSDEDPKGGRKTLSNLDSLDGRSVTFSSPMGRTTRYDSVELKNGTVEQTTRYPDGTQSLSRVFPDKTFTVVSPDGTSSSWKSQPDPRFGLAFAIPSTTEIKAPSGTRTSKTFSRSVSLSDIRDFMSLTRLEDRTFVYGRGEQKSLFDKASRTQTVTTPSGYENRTVYDDKGRILRVEVPGRAAHESAYDQRGRLASQTQGDRVTSYAYDSFGRLAAVTNPMGETARFTRDNAGRITQMTLPDLKQVSFRFDPADNLTQVVNPKNQLHAYSFDDNNLLVLNADPEIDNVQFAWSWTYNADSQPSQVLLPNGKGLNYSYDSAGRPSKVESSRGNHETNYDFLGRVYSMATPEGNALTFSWDGSLLKGMKWEGEVSSEIIFNWNDAFRISSESFDRRSYRSYSYLPEGNLAIAGQMTYGYDAQNGALIQTSLYNIQESIAYNNYNEVQSRSIQLNTSSLFSENFIRDKLGRVTHLTRSMDGQTDVFEYAYNSRGQLIGLSLNGTASAFTYDDNGNRLFEGGTIYDSQDRLLETNDWKYSYNASGHLQNKTSKINSTVYSYDYDEFGSLQAVAGPDGIQIDYVVDPLGRRIGKLKNGAFHKGWIYRDRLRPAAELDESGRIRTSFVYGSRPNVPDYIERDGRTYRIISDHIGSPHLVVDASTGAVAQKLTYDVWGRILSDSNPGFQPFGFAGGLYDPDTGLIRFGGRDYDPMVGRWTDKDQARFAGGLNFYVYVNNDPVNFFDQDGREPITLSAIAASVAINAAVGAAFDIAEQMLVDQKSFSCIDWGKVAESAIRDGLSGGLGKLRTAGRIAKAADGSSAKLGRAINKLKPDPRASGFPHTTLKRDPSTGKINNYETWQPNSRNPQGFQSVKRVDVTGASHGGTPTPHVHEGGGVRAAEGWEIPRN